MTMDRAELLRRLEGLADCDSRAGAPLGKAMRKAAAALREADAEIARLTAIARAAEAFIEIDKPWILRHCPDATRLDDLRAALSAQREDRT